MKPSAASNHFLFVSNDEHRKYNDDFDIRTHHSDEPRNHIVFVHVEKHVYMLRSATNPNYYIFCASDKSRAFGDDFDVRAHHHANDDRNLWKVKHHHGNLYTIKSLHNKK